MASYAELHILKEEEQVMLNMSNMLNDQLKRLQVEELALLSEIRAMQTEDTALEVNEEQNEQSEEPSAINQQPLASLGFIKEPAKEQETEEEFDSVDEDEALKSFIGSLKYNST